ncbi:hypothetical protein AC578_3076 [Lecanosticta acicola]|uniref:Uncharacterized protein n=1 Tax=Lecanosticta acicola TaxID=111012 RepID=A0AAI8Z246_9PEZI|nr:hypothetical protein AC578_3076 [Lecanosticta acicola]
MATSTMSRPSQPGPKRKREARTDIWSNLLRQTREAQARSRTQALQHRELIVCGGSPEDQRSFVQSISRPPPTQPPSRNQERKQQQRPKGELRLSNKYAYGYGHVTLYSPPQQSGTGVQVLGTEPEEVAQLEIHTLPEANEEYVPTLRRLLVKPKGEAEDAMNGEMIDGEKEKEDEDATSPGICIMLSWKEPWKFLDQLRRWMQVLAKALLQPGTPATDPMDVVKDAQLGITVVVQHTESQEDLLRDMYKEEDFDYISQCLRTALLPLHPLSALVYTTSSTPPQQPGSPLSEVQKVVYSSIRLNVSALNLKQPRSGDSAKKEELGPKHEFMDRMAIVIPAGWDSAAFIRTLSENFAPEDVLNAWLVDLQPPRAPKPQPQPQTEEPSSTDPKALKQTNGGAEVYESSPVDEAADDDIAEPPLSPSKMPPSAVIAYESRIQDPQAHKQQKPPQIEVTTKPDQIFLSEMREHLQQLESQDREREAAGGRSGVSNTSLSTVRVVGLPSGEQTGALNELGDVSFNVGGVSYDTISAEAAIERLKRPPPTEAQSSLSPTTRTSTPKPPRPLRDTSGEERRPSADRGTPRESASTSSRAASSESKDLPIDKLEEYFHSLMKKGGGSSRDVTPTKPRE